MQSTVDVTDPSPESDAEVELLRRCQAGEQQAYGELVERYRERAFWVAYHMVGDLHEARDLSQEAFLRVFRSIDSFDLKRSFFTWLYRIVANLAIDHLRKRGLRQAIPLDSVGEVQGNRGTPYHELVGEELSGNVGAILELLPPRYRQVIVMRDIHDLSSKEIGQIIGCKHATVRWQLHQARKLFREAWEAEFGSTEEVESRAG